MCAVARWLFRMSDVSCNQGGGNKGQLTLDRGIGLFLGRDRALGDGDQLRGETVLNASMSALTLSVNMASSRSAIVWVSSLTTMSPSASRIHA